MKFNLSVLLACALIVFGLTIASISGIALYESHRKQEHNHTSSQETIAVEKNTVIFPIEHQEEDNDTVCCIDGSCGSIVFDLKTESKCSNGFIYVDRIAVINDKVIIIIK